LLDKRDKGGESRVEGRPNTTRLNLEPNFAVDCFLQFDINRANNRL